MAAKYIYIDVNGVLHEIEGLVVSSGAGDAGKIIALGADGKLDLSVLPTGLGPDVASIVASEALTAPCFVNIWDDAGTPKIRYADASTAAAGKAAHGFIKASVAADATAEVYFEGEISGLSSLSPGKKAFLGTAGAPTETVPTTAGHILQVLGTITSASTINVELAEPIIRA